MLTAAAIQIHRRSGQRRRVQPKPAAAPSTPPAPLKPPQDNQTAAPETAGLPGGSRPYQVSTDNALLDYGPASQRMRLIGLAPGYSRDDVLDDMGFEPLVADELIALEPPRPEELAFLREEVDPDRVIIGRVE